MKLLLSRKSMKKPYVNYIMAKKMHDRMNALNIPSGNVEYKYNYPFKYPW